MRHRMAALRQDRRITASRRPSGRSHAIAGVQIGVHALPYLVAAARQEVAVDIKVVWIFEWPMNS